MRQVECTTTNDIVTMYNDGFERDEIIRTVIDTEKMKRTDAEICVDEVILQAKRRK